MTTEELIRRIKQAGIPITPAGMLNREATGKVLDVCDRTLADWRELKIGPPAVRINREWYYDVADVAKALTAMWHQDTPNTTPAQKATASKAPAPRGANGTKRPPG